MSERQTALIVSIPLPDALERIRARETEDPRLGIPAHVTLLYPFVAADAINDGVTAAVAPIVAKQPAFDVELVAVRRFAPSAESAEGVLWLAPEPSEPFVALTRALVAAFPEHPPYGGAHDEVIPHLTLATRDASRFDQLAGEAVRYLPIRYWVGEATLLVEGGDGRWGTGERFAFG